MARTEVTGKQIKDKSVSLADDVVDVLPVANGGTGSDTLTLNNVLLGNGTGALQTVAPGSSGYVLTSNGSSWVSAAATGNVQSVNGQDGEVVLDVADIAGAEDTANKGEPNGYASLDGDGLVPLIQLPADIGGGIDSVSVGAESFQFYNGTTPVGDPISLLLSALDGGTPSTVTASRVDGGTL